MNKNIGIQLLVYSVVLACLGYVAYLFAPTLARPTLIVGLTGGALCLVWGLRAFTGSQGKALPMLTLAPVAFMLLSQVMTNWLGEAVPGRRAAATVVTVAFLLSIGMLMRIAYAGVVFDGQQRGPTKDR